MAALQQMVISNQLVMNTEKLKFSFLLLLFCIQSGFSNELSNKNHQKEEIQIRKISFHDKCPRAEWMKGRYGLMVHWLAPPFEKPDSEEPISPLPQKGEYKWNLNDAVNGFDLNRFMAEFDQTGAEWLIFTIGQNTGTYASPNFVIDSLVGPGHTSQRDLIFEIARAVDQRKKRFIAYLPCEIRINKTLHKGLEWNSRPGTDQAKFQENYLEVVQEWSKRLGKYLDGWWFDGCYYDREPFLNKYMKWEQWYQAARAGNKDAVVTFNDGSFLAGYTKPVKPEHDYTSGESLVLVNSKIRITTKNGDAFFMPEQAFVEETKCLYHALLPIDGYWMHNRRKFPDWANVPFDFDPSKREGMPPPIYSNNELIKFVKDFTNVGGAVTLNVNITQEGYLCHETLTQLKRLYNCKTNTEISFPENHQIDSVNFDFFGFQGHKFTFMGKEARIVYPKKIAEDKPWVWRARFWGHEPQVDLAMLERGYHIVFCDVSELFGNDEALNIWNKFYQTLIGTGFNNRSIMEGMSRGGMYIYRWAECYPERVAAIYADAPVLDMKSWPGGFGEGMGSSKEWEIFKKNFGFQNDFEAMNFNGNPIDFAEEIAKAGFPIIHVVGDRDRVVPVKENTALFEKKIKEAAGYIFIIHKPETGHHPHCLNNPAPIVDFLCSQIEPH